MSSEEVTRIVINGIIILDNLAPLSLSTVKPAATATITLDIPNISEAIGSCLQNIITQMPPPPTPTPSPTPELRTASPTFLSKTHYYLNWLVLFYHLLASTYYLALTIQAQLKRLDFRTSKHESFLFSLLLTVPVLSGIFWGTGALLGMMRITLFDGWFGVVCKLYMGLLGFGCLVYVWLDNWEDTSGFRESESERAQERKRMRMRRRQEEEEEEEGEELESALDDEEELEGLLDVTETESVLDEAELERLARWLKDEEELESESDENEGVENVSPEDVWKLKRGPKLVGP